MPEQRLFLPGLAARGSLYAPGLPAGWTALDPPSLGRTHGSFGAQREWLVEELARDGRPASLAGHSLGAALAIAAAADRPDLVERLTLFSPAGLPLSKPMRDSLWLLVQQVVRGLYPVEEVAAVVGEAVRRPWAMHRLARAAHDLDLREEMTRVAGAGIPGLVVACTSDTLTTPGICRAIAAGLGCGYEEIEGAGHMWMLSDRPRFRRLLADSEA
ncbi:MAG TPA: alpha/beta fold hydrolase [Gaiellaceae bacterium]|nr:alpha/beta fold hydrolase [Gaiellaceae bacterium]